MLGHRAADDGQELELTAQQFRLLTVLMRNPGRVMSRDQLLAAAWDPAQEVSSNVVEQSISGLRARLLSQPEALSAGQVMRRDIPHAAPESTIGALLPLLSGPGAHAVPILNRGRIRGIVTQTDLIAALARQLLRPRAAPPA